VLDAPDLNSVFAIMAQTQVQIGEKLGSFRIESVLGSGAMGVVYRGTNEKNGRAAAVKVVAGELTAGKKIVERFEREAEILQQFRHPNIVRFLAVGRYKGTSYIAMEFVEGVTLEKVIADRGPLPWREVVELGIQICEALHYAHEHGVVHRDLKPSNLMVTPDGKIKLTDFGIAKDLDATALTATGRTLGTAAFMAPEQIRGTPAVSHKTDLYALGVVLYQMLVGKPPFEGSTPVVLMHCHLNEPPPRPSAKVEEIPKAIDELVVTLMAKAPADRPWDAAAAGAKLSELRDKAEKGKSIAMVWPGRGAPAGAPQGSSPTPGAGPTERRKKKSRKTTFAGLSLSTIGTSGGGDQATEPTWLNRSVIETAGLAAALLVVGGFIAYWVWPPSASYLYRQAETLMANNSRHDWRTALDEYIKPLDERFPDHPYREKTNAWRDKIMLEEIEGRASILESPVKTAFNEPKDNHERGFVLTHALASEASKRGDDLAAIAEWQKFAQQAKPDDPEERNWHLLALKRAASLENEIALRRQYVERQLQAAVDAFRAGHTTQGVAIKNKVREQYQKYTDLADLFPPTPAPGEAATANGAAGTATSPAKTPAGSDTVPEAADGPKGAPSDAPDGKAVPKATASGPPAEPGGEPESQPAGNPSQTAPAEKPGTRSL
jgi:eukaryotic-like serine/threonine-protein kinase